MLAGDDATPDALRDEILALLDNPARRQELADTARRHGRPDAADRVVTELLETARTN